MTQNKTATAALIGIAVVFAIAAATGANPALALPTRRQGGTTMANLRNTRKQIEENNQRSLHRIAMRLEALAARYEDGGLEVVDKNDLEDLFDILDEFNNGQRSLKQPWPGDEVLYSSNPPENLQTFRVAEVRWFADQRILQIYRPCVAKSNILVHTDEVELCSVPVIEEANYESATAGIPLPADGSTPSSLMGEALGADIAAEEQASEDLHSEVAALSATHDELMECAGRAYGAISRAVGNFEELAAGVCTLDEEYCDSLALAEKELADFGFSQGEPEGDIAKNV